MKQIALIVFLFTNSIPQIARAAIFISQDEFDRSAAYGQASRFDSVGAIWDDTVDGIYRFGGSAVLIAPQWVLASGHQVIRPGGPRGTVFDFRLGNELANMTSVHPISEVFVHPNWLGDSSEGSMRGQPDLALFKLASPILTVTPATRVREIENGDMIGRQLFMAGYGTSGVDGVFTQPGDLKRGGTNLLANLQGGFPGDPPEASLNLYVDSREGFWDNRIDMEWKGGPGDSGGGWFFENNGVLELAGITSFGGLPAINATFTGATRISLYNNWIDSTITAVPEPSSLILLSLITTAAVAYRKRSNQAMHRSRGSVAS